MEYANVRIEKEAYDKAKEYCKKNDKIIIKVISRAIENYINSSIKEEV